MSSPFADKFLGKSPMSPTSKALVGGQNRLSPELQAAIKASPADMHHGSPAEKHDPKAIATLEAKLARVKKGEEGAEGQGGVDYELQVEVEKQIKEAKGDHKMKKKNESVANYGSPLDASYSNPNDYHYVSNAADFQRLQDNIVAGTKAAMSPKIIDNYQEKRADRRDKRGVKKGEGTLDASGNYVPTDANSKFNKKTQFIRNKSDKYQNQSKCTPGSVTVNKDGSTTTCP
jgi:hypothetical protein